MKKKGSVVTDKPLIQSHETAMCFTNTISLNKKAIRNVHVLYPGTVIDQYEF